MNMLLFNQYLLAARELAFRKPLTIQESDAILAKYGLFVNNMTTDELAEIQRLIEEFEHD